MARQKIRPQRLNTKAGGVQV